jgi:hypothetical protein
MKIHPPSEVTTASIVAALLMWGACGPHRPSTPAPGPAETGFVLRVINHYKLDVTVYLIHDGQRNRVGTATAMARHDFALPARLLGASHQISLAGDPIGSGAVVRTEQILVEPGQTVEWTLESLLQNSNVAVY